MKRIFIHHTFTPEEDEYIIQLMKQGIKRNWHCMAAHLFKRFKTKITPILIRDRWSLLFQQLKGQGENIFEYIQALKQTKFRYAAASKLMGQSIFKNIQYGKEYIKQIYIEMLQYLEDFSKEKLKKNILKLQDEQRKNLAIFLLRGSDRHRGLKYPYALRDRLIQIYEAKTRKIKLKKQVIVQACKILKKLKQQTMCERKYCKFNDGWQYKWSNQELQHGQNFIAISKIMKQELGEKQIYNWLILRSKMIKMQKLAFKNLKNQLKQRDFSEIQDFEFSFKPQTARKFVWDIKDKQFPYSVKLMSLSFGGMDKISGEQLVDLYNFVNYYLGKDKSKSSLLVKAQQKKLAKQILKTKLRSISKY